MSEVLVEFKLESESLVKKISEELKILEKSPEDQSVYSRIGNQSDRIMGGAKALVASIGVTSGLDQIALFSEVLKTLSYIAFKIESLPPMHQVLHGIFSECLMGIEALVSSDKENEANLKSLLKKKGHILEGLEDLEKLFQSYTGLDSLNKSRSIEQVHNLKLSLQRI